MLRLMFFLLGFGLAIIGFMYIIAYLNYLTIGYTWQEYFSLITHKPECLLAFIGITILGLIIFTRRRENDIRI